MGVIFGDLGSTRMEASEWHTYTRRGLGPVSPHHSLRVAIVCTLIRLLHRSHCVDTRFHHSSEQCGNLEMGQTSQTSKPQSDAAGYWTCLGRFRVTYHTTTKNSRLRPLHNFYNTLYSNKTIVNDLIKIFKYCNCKTKIKKLYVYLDFAKI